MGGGDNILEELSIKMAKIWQSETLFHGFFLS